MQDKGIQETGCCIINLDSWGLVTTASIHLPGLLASSIQPLPLFPATFPAHHSPRFSLLSLFIAWFVGLNIPVPFTLLCNLSACWPVFLPLCGLSVFVLLHFSLETVLSVIDRAVALLCLLL